MLTLQERSLNWALQHALEVGDTDVFPKPFEYEAIRHDWSNIRTELAATDVLTWPTRPARILLSPKAKYGFRPITQLDPLDFLIFSGLVHEVATDLESRRIAVQREVVFSYRVDIGADGQLFDSNIGYRQFLNKCRSKVSADEGPSHVAATDISDFYSRIYHHRLENALCVATNKRSHVKAVMNLLSGWNGTETFGIPVGCDPSRLLAEVALSDVDEALLANGIDFVRFNDDYRIFADSTTAAYKQIVFLADILFRNHGLSLQPQKTRIYTRDQFSEWFLSTPLDREMNSLHDRFQELIESLNLDGWYEEIDYDDLSGEQQAIVDALNLVQLFREEAGKDEPDIPVVKFCLRRLAQLGNDGIVDDVFSNLESLAPVFAEVIAYIASLRYMHEEKRHKLGSRLLNLLQNSIVSELAYHRMWVMHVFTVSREWDNEGSFAALYNKETDQACRRKLILAMGRAQQTHWFQSQWRSLFDHPHWQRRAVLAAGSCMATDARKHWYRSVEPQLDLLEKAVVRWARQNPYAV